MIRRGGVLNKILEYGYRTLNMDAGIKNAERTMFLKDKFRFVGFGFFGALVLMHQITQKWTFWERIRMN